ncbi:MAG: hypothetical protein K9H49_09525 [Bacteroidales bacterium]|nr:hypothetical protein [Bacteroidales bacterium]MCF8391950.1 hypothetical protein [Bacteroidales bacterium]
MRKKDGKLTIKHYLNKRAKSKTLNGESFYPLYIQIIVSGHKAQIKSRIQDFIVSYKDEASKFFIKKSVLNLISEGYFSQKLLDEIEREEIFPFFSLLADEIKIIGYIINSEQPFTNKYFSLIKISSSYELYLKDIYLVLNDALKRFYLEELNSIFLKSTKNETDKKLFKVTNFFIHYINWGNNFCEYYETTYEVLPSEIKFIENSLSKEMKLQIKAALAFHSKLNYLKRFLEKKQKGLIPKLNLIDWRESGKEFMIKEFTIIFGKQKAKEYINSIDIILSNEISHPIKMGKIDLY